MWWLIPLIVLWASCLQALEQKWPMVRPDVMDLEYSPYHVVLGQVGDYLAKGDYVKVREEAEKALHDIEPAANRESVDVVGFQDAQHPTHAMDASALLLFYDGRAAFRLEDFAAAKPIVEKLWRKYPFVRIADGDKFFSPAHEGFRMWMVLRWMEAIRAGKLSTLPVDPNLHMYQDTPNEMKGLGFNSAVYEASYYVFKKDGPKPIEAALKQMMESDVFHNIYRSDCIAKMLSGISEPFRSESASTEEWEKHRAMLEKWAAADPKSDTAKMALVQFWINYAWRARGNDVARNVTDDGWKGFEERLQTALKIQSAALIKHPMWYFNGLNLGLGLGAPPKGEMALFQEGMEKYPWFSPLYMVTQHYLLPRWHGNPGDWQRFTTLVGRTVDPELYIYLMEHVKENGEEMLPIDYDLDGSLEPKGYLARVKREPTWAITNQCAHYACLMRLKDVAKAAFDNKECRFHPIYWNNEEDFNQWRAWANGGPTPQVVR